MSVVLFALIGAQINAGVAYWICFAVYCAIKLGVSVYKALDERD